MAQPPGTLGLEGSGVKPCMKARDHLGVRGLAVLAGPTTITDSVFVITAGQLRRPPRSLSISYSRLDRSFS
jgi:hypothetical protein